MYPVYDSGESHVSISKGNQKLGNIPGFNTLAGDGILSLSNGKQLTNIEGTCKGVCEHCKSSCYAINFLRFHHKNTVSAYARNTMIMRNDPEKVCAEITEYCKKNIVRYFRYHTSGEIESVEQLKTYASICYMNQDVTFYIYTKNFAVLEKWFEDLDKNGLTIPENFIINLSEWKDNLSFMNGKHHRFFDECNIFAYDEDYDKDYTHCPAINKTGHETGTTCAMCRRCMRKGNKTAVYPH